MNGLYVDGNWCRYDYQYSIIFIQMLSIFQFGASLLPDAKVTDEYVYEIKVHTGTRLNSGTLSNVYIELTGKCYYFYDKRILGKGSWCHSNFQKVIFIVLDLCTDICSLDTLAALCSSLIFYMFMVWTFYIFLKIVST